MEFSHYSVMLEECISGLAIRRTVFMWTGQQEGLDIPARLQSG